MKTVRRFEADLARWVLGLISDRHLPEVATNALLEGLESRKLAILAGERDDGSSLIARDLLRRALVELGMATPSSRDAVLLLRGWWLQELAWRRCEPMTALAGLVEEAMERGESHGFTNSRVVGDALGLEAFVGAYWRIRDGEEEGYLLPAERKAIEAKAVHEAELALLRPEI